ncbi:MAG: GAF domain-containing protein [Deltaproteobacteria bacterium]|nr:MAG: GAF domain-containing protein [Deltaproteobacteria bacterium]
MRPLNLRKVLRGGQKAALMDVLALAPDVVRIEDLDGKPLFGGEGDGEVTDIRHGDALIGRVIGGASSERIAGVVAWIYDREQEKRSLAAETLDRYKELSLLYDLGEKLSRELELADVARAVLTDAQRHLRASGGALYLLDRQHGTLEAVAWVGDDSVPKILPADRGIASQVLETGRALFVDESSGGQPESSLDQGPTSMICAPLRIGERVFGVIRLWQEGLGTWTSGDLKLVAALAANASSAVSAAQLHTQRVRELALLHQLERHVSSGLLQACYGDTPPTQGKMVIACCDPRTLVSVRGAERVEHVVEAVEGGTARAIGAFLEAGAVVDTPQGIVLGLFTGEAAPANAVEAARRAIRAVEAFAPTGLGASTPGVGIACANIEGEATEGLYAGINTAAVLQTDSSGRLIVDADVAQSLGELTLTSLGTRELPRGTHEVFEVNW